MLARFLAFRKFKTFVLINFCLLAAAVVIKKFKLATIPKPNPIVKADHPFLSMIVVTGIRKGAPVIRHESTLLFMSRQTKF